MVYKEVFFNDSALLRITFKKERMFLWAAMNPLVNPVFLSKLIHSYLFDVNRVYRSTPEQLQRYQDKHFCQVVRYAYTVPLYHEKYKQAGIHPHDITGTKDAEKLPYVTKQDFRGKTADTLLPAGKNPSKYAVVSTSGSTGKPVTLYSDPYTIFHTFIGFIRSIREHDVNWRKTRMALIADLTPDSAEEAYFRRTAMPSLKSVFSLKNQQVFHVGDPAEKLLKDLEQFQPEFIGGYPGVLKILAILKKQGKAPKLLPRVIATSGAILDEYTRQYIKTAFSADLFDAYGATECSPMAFECKHGHYHVNSDFVFMELIDPKEKETISGDGGNIVVTRLFGRGTPVVRYTGISDLVIPSDETSESCGIHTQILEGIGGRQVDAIVLPSGEMIPPSAFTGIPHHVMHTYKTEKIQQFQIIQQNRTDIEILLVIDETLRDEGPSVETLVDEIKKMYNQKLGKEMNITIREVKKITHVREGSATPPPVVISKVHME